MAFILSYRRPTYVNSNEKAERGPHGIPDELSFDRILEGKTQSPCTTRDFMDFLIYVDRDAQNLQFYLWFRDYKTRYAHASSAERSVSPVWGQKPGRDFESPYTPYSRPGTPDIADGASVTEFAPALLYSKPNSLREPPRSVASRHSSDSRSHRGDVSPMSNHPSHPRGLGVAANVPFGSAETLHPAMLQPFREEIKLVIAIYMADGAHRQLNLSSQERGDLIQALTHTTHPAAFEKVAESVEWNLRHQAHPNFIRWVIGNANPARTIFNGTVGVVLIFLGFLAAVLLTLSRAAVGWRVISVFPFFFGSLALITSLKGMCVLLHGYRQRQLRPWEQAIDDNPDAEIIAAELKGSSLDGLGSGNCFQHEPWVQKYHQRPLLRRIIDREVVVDDIPLRKLQDIIFTQAFVSSMGISSALLVIFCMLPVGNGV